MLAPVGAFGQSCWRPGRSLLQPDRDFYRVRGAVSPSLLNPEGVGALAAGRRGNAAEQLGQQVWRAEMLP